MNQNIMNMLGLLFVWLIYFVVMFSIVLVLMFIIENSIRIVT